MLGAILGDMVGSPYEFDWNNHKSKDFSLLSEKSHFTDDTVMTAAVARGLIAGKGIPERTFEEELEQEEVTAENWNGGYDEDGKYGYRSRLFCKRCCKASHRDT